jgi:O-antigen/teichoic acid export membrane protein
MSQAVLPRLTKLFAEDRLAASFQLYRNATQTVNMIIYPGVAALVFFAEPIMYAWTGRADFAHEAAPILRLYAIGNGLAALNLFSYYIQYARGRLHLHFIGSTFLLILLIPAFVFGGIYYGGVGTGMAWAVANGIYFIFWVPLVHARFFSGQHLNWLIHDILVVIGLPTLAGFIISWMIPWPHQREVLIAYLGMVGILFLVTSIAASSFGRATTLRLVRRFIALKWQSSPSE